MPEGHAAKLHEAEREERTMDIGSAIIRVEGWGV